VPTYTKYKAAMKNSNEPEAMNSHTKIACRHIHNKLSYKTKWIYIILMEKSLKGVGEVL